MKSYVQIGAGAGDLDKNFPDGFTNYVKSLPKNEIQNIFLVEANPLNIEKLKECWRDYPQAVVLNIGIKPSKVEEDNITFYYAEEDGPNYQVFSMIKQHVLNHLPECTLKEISVDCITINHFLKEIVKTKNIELMAFDIEGIDADIILEVNWENLNCLDFSFEKIHLHDKFETIKKLLQENGFKEIGKGLDLRGYDVMFSRR
jgi:hypothetical protein